MTPGQVASRNLRWIRMARQMSQRDLSAKVGIEQTTISRIETGNRHMTIDELFLFADCLSVHVLALLDVDLAIFIESPDEIRVTGA